MQSHGIMAFSENIREATHVITNHDLSRIRKRLESIVAYGLCCFEPTEQSKRNYLHAIRLSEGISSGGRRMLEDLGLRDMYLPSTNFALGVPTQGVSSG